MPIFEFFCPDCHAVFSFLATSGDEGRRPACPQCQRPDLERQPSTFAVGRGAQAPEEDLAGEVSDARLAEAMSGLAQNLESLGDDSDPRVLSRALRAFGSETGLDLGPGLQEALDKLDQGADPEEVERQLDEADSLSELFRLQKRASAASAPPRKDPGLYSFDEPTD